MFSSFVIDAYSREVVGWQFAEQCTSFDYTQALHDHRVLASIASVGGAYENATAASVVDGFKTGLISDRGWRT